MRDRIRCTIIALALVTCAQAAGAQTRPGDTFKWNQPTSEVVSIPRFELRIDAGAWTDVGKVEANDAQTPAGTTSYRATVPALMSGSYTFAVRACPTTGTCGPEATPFAFAVIVISSPSGLRIGPG